MLIEKFNKFLELSNSMRPEFKGSLGVKRDYWKDIIEIYSFEIPEIFKAIYSSVSGTKRDLENQSLFDFIPSFRLIHIDEFPEEKLIVDNINNKTNCLILPILADYSSNYICYVRNVFTGEEEIVALFQDEPSPILMHKSPENFLETICQFYLKDVYFLDEDGYLDYNVTKEGYVGELFNEGVKYWSS